MAAQFLLDALGVGAFVDVPTNDFRLCQKVLSQHHSRMR